MAKVAYSTDGIKRSFNYFAKEGLLEVDLLALDGSVLATMSVIKSGDKPASVVSNSPSLNTLKPMAFAQGEVYRALDDQQVIAVVSPEQLELRQGGTNLVCQYTKQGDSIRVIATMLGTTQALYYTLTQQGLSAPDGTVLYDSRTYQTTMARVNAQRRQADLNRGLRDAAERGDVTSMNNLVGQGAQIEAKATFNATELNHGDLTPLGVAVDAWNVDGVRWLLDHGADPNCISEAKAGRTPLSVAAGDSNRGGFDEVDRRRTEAYTKIIPLLIDHGAHLNDQDARGWTPLMWAANQNNVEATKLLIKAGADVTIRDKHGSTLTTLAGGAQGAPSREMHALLDALSVTVTSHANAIPSPQGAFAAQDSANAGQRSQQAELRLNEVYSRLRRKLPEAQKQLLKEEEIRWLKRRDPYPNSDMRRVELTEQRVHQLEQRLEAD